MEYVQLGRSGLKCAAVSFGGIPIQRSNAANTCAVVDALEKFGMNYIDTARGYTVSEEYLGAALEGRRDNIIARPLEGGAYRPLGITLPDLSQATPLIARFIRYSRDVVHSLHAAPGEKTSK